MVLELWPDLYLHHQRTWLTFVGGTINCKTISKDLNINSL